MKLKIKDPILSNKEKLVWHEWFAWYPVRIDSYHMVWLETVKRRGNVEYSYEGERYWVYEYVRIKNDSNDKETV